MLSLSREAVPINTHSKWTLKSLCGKAFRMVLITPLPICKGDTDTPQAVKKKSDHVCVPPALGVAHNRRLVALPTSLLSCFLLLHALSSGLNLSSFSFSLSSSLLSPSPTLPPSTLAASVGPCWHWLGGTKSHPPRWGSLQFSGYRKSVSSLVGCFGRRDKKEDKEGFWMKPQALGASAGALPSVRQRGPPPGLHTHLRAIWLWKLRPQLEFNPPLDTLLGSATDKYISMYSFYESASQINTPSQSQRANLNKPSSAANIAWAPVMRRGFSRC